MKICFLAISLLPGGAERVISVLANALVNRNYQVSIVLISNEPVFYTLDSRINMVHLDLERKNKNFFDALANNYIRIKAVVTILRKIGPDILIGFMPYSNVVSIFAGRILNIPVILSERSNPYYDPVTFFWRIGRKIFYRFAHCLILQTERVKHYFRKYGVPMEIIENPLRELVYYPIERERIILGIGRLASEKGFDRLIQAYRDLNSDYKLLILGEGEERARLEQLITSLQLTDKVVLVGLVRDIDAYLSKAAIFVLCSKYEGFPNVLCEAMAHGVACVSFNCDYGPEALIVNHVNGVLVENGNVNALSAVLQTLIDCPEQRIALGDNAKKIVDRLNVNRIVDKWEAVFCDALNK